MNESGFPWPWPGEGRRISLLVLGWVLLLNLWALVAIDVLPITRKSPWDPPSNQRAPLFARYDSGWYDSIIRFGYRPAPDVGEQSAHAFFPLYPMAARYLHLAAATLCEGRPWLRRLWLGVSTVGLLVNSALFTNWHFVS